MIKICESKSCHRCNSAEDVIKCGVVRGGGKVKQWYLCKNCNRRFTGEVIE